MRIFFNYCHLDGYTEDSNVKFGLGWYKHHKDNTWKGLTLELYLFPWLFQCTYVDNWVEYDKKINYRLYKKDKKFYKKDKV